jgi:hypothetical protein
MSSLTYSFGFAKFQTIEQGVACIIGLSGYGYQCSFAKVLSLRLISLSQESFSNRLKELSEPGNTNLYISNLPLDVDEQVTLYLHPLLTIAPG